LLLLGAVALVGVLALRLLDGVGLLPLVVLARVDEQRQRGQSGAERQRQRQGAVHGRASQAGREADVRPDVRQTSRHGATLRDASATAEAGCASARTAGGK